MQKCKVCKKEGTIYKSGKSYYCRNHFPGSDPAEHEKGYIDYENRFSPSHVSLDHGWEKGKSHQYSTSEALEVISQREADNRERQKEAKEDQISSLSEKAEYIKRMLTPVQYDIYQLLIYQKLAPSQIASLLGTSTSSVDHQLEAIGKKLSKLFT